MAAEVMARAGLAVTVFEAKPSPARKFLMAGKSGLNLTFEGDFDKVLSGYGPAAGRLRPALQAFGNEALRGWAEGLGQELFVGSTGRVFPRAMKASPLLRAWLARLAELGVTLRPRARISGLDGRNPILDNTVHDADVTVLACGGASWARLGSDGAWTGWLGAPCADFQPSNVGVTVPWTPHMAPYIGGAIKAVSWSAGSTVSRGEAVLTEAGLEGGGIYALTPALRTAPLHLDLVPDLEAATLGARWAAKPKKTTRAAWLRKSLGLSPLKRALAQEFGRGAADWPTVLKALPVPTTGFAPMDKAISTAGGLTFAGLDDTLMLHDRPGVFCAGEMLDWDAPTGGWLLTACFATGAWAGRHAALWAEAHGKEL